jgi:hypothetical protein
MTETEIQAASQRVAEAFARPGPAGVAALGEIARLHGKCVMIEIIAKAAPKMPAGVIWPTLPIH